MTRALGTTRAFGWRALVALWLAGMLCVAGAAGLARPAGAAAPESTPWIHTTAAAHLGFQLYWYDGFTDAPDPQVTGYDVQYREKGATAWLTKSHSGRVRAVEFSGLTAGQAYEVRVRATNDDGAGGWSDVESLGAVVNYATQVNPPFPLLVETGDSQVGVSWGPPSYTGGRTLTGYVIRLRLGDTFEVVRRITISDATAASTLIRGLTNGIEYSVEMYATYGDPDRSGLTSAVEYFTPSSDGATAVAEGRCNLAGYTAPDPPPITSVTPAARSVTVRWDSPGYGTRSDGRTPDWITDFMLYVTTAGGQWVATEFVTAEWSETATYTHTVSGLQPATGYRVQVAARTITACYSGWSAVAATTAAGGQQRQQGSPPVGVLERPENPGTACTVVPTSDDMVALVRGYHDMNKARADYSHNWFRVLIAFGAETSDTLGPYTVAEAKRGEQVWSGWTPVREELERLENDAATCN